MFVNKLNDSLQANVYHNFRSIIGSDGLVLKSPRS